MWIIYYLFAIPGFLIGLKSIRDMQNEDRKKYEEMRKRYKNPTIKYDSREYYLVNEHIECYSKDVEVELNEKHWLVPCDEIPDMSHALPAIPTLKKYNYIRMGYSDIKGVCISFPKEIPATTFFDLVSFKLWNFLIRTFLFIFCLSFLLLPLILYGDKMLVIMVQR